MLAPAQLQQASGSRSVELEEVPDRCKLRRAGCDTAAIREQMSDQASHGMPRLYLGVLRQKNIGAYMGHSRCLKQHRSPMPAA